MRIMHIGALYPPEVVGGAEKSVQLLAEGQVQAGHRVAVVCLTGGGDRRESINGVDVTRLNHRSELWFDEAEAASRVRHLRAKLVQPFNERQAAVIQSAIKEFSPDIINTHSLVGVSSLVWRDIARLNIPIVHTIRDYDLLCSNSSMYKSGKNCESQHLKCSILSLDRAIRSRYLDGVISISQNVLDRHLESGMFKGIPVGCIDVIWNAAPEVDDDLVRYRRSGDFVFGYLGRITPEKGIATIIDAMRKIEGGGFRLHVAGKVNDYARRCLQGVEGLPIDFQGFIDPGEFFSRIDTLIVPSLWAEPLGRIVLEAYAHGVPALGSTAGGIPELIGRENYAWLFEPGNAEELANKMKRIIELGRESLPDRRSFSNVLEQTSAKVVVEKYDRFYDRVVRNKVSQGEARR